MSWAANRTALKTVLTNSGYKELPQLIKDDMPIVHKTYYMQPVGVSLENYSDNGIAGTHKVNLILYYINNDSTQRDANYQLFLDLIKNISAVSEFNGYSDDASFVDGVNNTTIGTLNFLIGVEVC